MHLGTSDHTELNIEESIVTGRVALLPPDGLMWIHTHIFLTYLVSKNLYNSVFFPQKIIFTIKADDWFHRILLLTTKAEPDRFFYMLHLLLRCLLFLWQVLYELFLLCLETLLSAFAGLLCLGAARLSLVAAQMNKRN